MPAPSEIQIPASTAPGERERVAALSHPVPRGDVGERSAPRPLRRKPNSSPECLHRQKSKSPPEQPRESSRGSHPLAPRHPRGCRGAERPTPASSEAKSFTRTPAPTPSKTQIPARSTPRESAPLRQKSNSSPEHSNLPRQKPKFSPAQPHGRAREGRSPLAPRPSRGCRGAERPTPASPETKFFAGMPEPSEIQIPASTAPRESARGSQPSRTPSPEGCRGAECPTPVSSETEFSTRTVKPAPLEIQIPARTAPGERERV